MSPEKLGEWVLAIVFAFVVMASVIGGGAMLTMAFVKMWADPTPAAEQHCSDGVKPQNYRPGDPKRYPFVCADGKVFP